MAGKKFRYIYVDPAPKCEYCGDEKFDKKNLEPRNLNKNHLVDVTTYVCDHFGKTHRTSLKLFIDKYDTYTKDVKGLAIQVNYLRNMSLINISLINGCVNGSKPCRGTILNSLRKYYQRCKFKYKCMKKLSGNYGYDEQYIKIAGQKFYILALFDIELNISVDYRIVGDLKNNTVKNFIANATKDYKNLAITTDARPMYRDIVESLGDR
ncbi:MAG: hypothetical protein LBT10_03645 [Methanobrevibacter sp.]|jgi:transposase-like protein|nr:hypothetical protein [Methanobrevibacter sp.]